MRVRRFGGPDVLEVVELPLPEPGRGEVRVRVLASSVQFTDTVIRRGRYPQLRTKPPFVVGYDVVGEIDRVGPGVDGLSIGERVADLTVTGSNTTYRTLEARRVTRVPAGVDAAEAATLVLSWMTAYQLLHRVAAVRAGERVLVLGAAGAVGQALLALLKLIGAEAWGAVRGDHGALVAALGATPIDARTEDFGRVLPDGFDAVFDGVAEDGFRRAWSAVKRGGRLSAYGFTAALDRSTATMGAWLARLYLWNALPNGKRASFYSIGAMRARHPEWFRADLKLLFAMLAARTIAPRVAERISFEGVADAHRRLDAGGLEGKVVLCPDLQPPTRP